MGTCSWMNEPVASIEDRSTVFCDRVRCLPQSTEGLVLSTRSGFLFCFSSDDILLLSANGDQTEGKKVETSERKERKKGKKERKERKTMNVCGHHGHRYGRSGAGLGRRRRSSGAAVGLDDHRRRHRRRPRRHHRHRRPHLLLRQQNRYAPIPSSCSFCCCCCCCCCCRLQSYLVLPSETSRTFHWTIEATWDRTEKDPVFNDCCCCCSCCCSCCCCRL